MTDSESPSPVGEPIDVAAFHAHCADLERQLAEAHAQLRQAVNQQTATAEVLSASSRSAFDLQVVLDSLARSAIRLCLADSGGIGRVDGDAFRYESLYAQNPETEAMHK